MGHYLLRRVATSAIVLVGLSMVIFLLLHIVYPRPGRDVLGINATVGQVDSWNRQHGFDAPVAVQYWRYAWKLLHGNLGYSYERNQLVTALFATRWARSAYLNVASLLLAFLVAFPLGIFQAARRNRLVDHVMTGLQMVLYAVPAYIFFILAIQLLAITVPVFSFEASQSTSVLSVMTDWHDMTLPIVGMAVFLAVGFSRYMRSAAIDTLAEDYIKVARAKGLSERLVLSRHLLRNACLPMITLMGFAVPALLSGNVFIESIFNYNGLGTLFYQSLWGRPDYPILLAYTLVAAILTILGNLLADITMTIADPRLRLTSAGQLSLSPRCCQGVRRPRRLAWHRAARIPREPA